MPFVKKRTGRPAARTRADCLDGARDRPRAAHAARVVGVEERSVNVEHDGVDPVEQASPALPAAAARAPRPRSRRSGRVDQALDQVARSGSGAASGRPGRIASTCSAGSVIRSSSSSSLIRVAVARSSFSEVEPVLLVPELLGSGRGKSSRLDVGIDLAGQAARTGRGRI